MVVRRIAWFGVCMFGCGPAAGDEVAVDSSTSASSGESSAGAVDSSSGTSDDSNVLRRCFESIPLPSASSVTFVHGVARSGDAVPRLVLSEDGDAWVLGASAWPGPWSELQRLGELPSLTIADVDGDGRDDLLTGGNDRRWLATQADGTLTDRGAFLSDADMDSAPLQLPGEAASGLARVVEDTLEILRGEGDASYGSLSLTLSPLPGLAFWSELGAHAEGVLEVGLTELDCFEACNRGSVLAQVDGGGNVLLLTRFESRVRFVALVDVDRDERLDTLFTRPDEGLFLRRGHANGLEDAPTDEALVSGSVRAVLQDLDGDGELDLLVVRDEVPEVQWSFAGVWDDPQVASGLELDGLSIATAADFDADGAAELVVAGAGDNLGVGLVQTVPCVR